LMTGAGEGKTTMKTSCAVVRAAAGAGLVTRWRKLYSSIRDRVARRCFAICKSYFGG